MCLPVCFPVCIKKEEMRSSSWALREQARLFAQCSKLRKGDTASEPAKRSKQMGIKEAFWHSSKKVGRRQSDEGAET